MKVKVKNTGNGALNSTPHLLFHAPRPPTPANPQLIVLGGSSMFISRVLVPNFMRGWWKHIRCGYTNPYVGRNGDAKRTIDARCMSCGQRVNFNSHRAGNRGRNRKVLFTIRPDHMPRHAIIKECRQRNRGIPENAVLHFRKLKEIVHVESNYEPGSIAQQKVDDGIQPPNVKFVRREE